MFFVNRKFTSLLTTISTMGNHTCIITSGGEVRCWGNGGYGQLGNNISSRSPFPVAVVGEDTNSDNSGDGTLTNIVQISSGSVHTCALTSGGEVRCWGRSDQGTLGNNSNSDSPFPVTVVGEDTNSDNSGDGTLKNIVQISSGDSYTCALTSGGEVRCWGYGEDGRLGNNNNSNSPFPVTVVGEDKNSDNSGDGTLTNIVQISSGYVHTCALTSGGEVRCWGYGEDGRLGNNNNSNSPFPVTVVGEDTNGDNSGDGTLKNIVQISLGYYHTCALTSGGEVRCWGSGSSGTLGNNSNSNSPFPVTVVGEDTNGDNSGDSTLKNIVQISSGHDHTCALTSGGEVRCWGNGSSGTLGNNSNSNSPFPVTVVGEDTNGDNSGDSTLKNIVQISSGYVHTCALTSGGEMRCWGPYYLDYYGQLVIIRNGSDDSQQFKKH